MSVDTEQLGIRVFRNHVVRVSRVVADSLPVVCLVVVYRVEYTVGTTATECIQGMSSQSDITLAHTLKHHAEVEALVAYAHVGTELEALCAVTDNFAVAWIIYCTGTGIDDTVTVQVVKED